MMSSTSGATNTTTEHERVIESRIHAFRNAAHTLVFAVCEGNDVAHALSSAREQLVQLKLAMTASAQLRNDDNDDDGESSRCDVCGWSTRLDAVQLQFESISNQNDQSHSDMALDEHSNDNHHHHHQQCHRCRQRRQSADSLN